MENKIKLVQKPVIEHELKKAGKRVTDRLAELNLDNQVATIETLKFFKETRATLNKEFADFETDRKFIKNACLNPYKELEDVYKVEISEKYKQADDLLKKGISSVEIGLKEEKEANLKLYFIELCQSYNIDFLIFDNVGLDINLSISEKKYKEQCNDFVERVVDDVELINTMEFKAEIMAEYKLNLNASQSIKNINDRKERERQEAERIKQQELNNRILKLKAIGMQFDEMTKCYSYNDEIYIQEENIMSFKEGDFSLKVVEFEEKIKADKKADELKKEEKQETQQKTEQPKEPLKAPVKEEKQEIVTASFKVKGTMKQLKALGQYMRENGITYKNI